MKYAALVVFTTFVGVFTLVGDLSYAENLSQSSPREEHNKSIVLRYMQEVLDGKQYATMNELFTTDIVMHRPEGVLSNLPDIQMIFEGALSPHTLQTTIHDMFASGDRVFVRLSHRMTYSSKHGFLQSRLGMYDVSGKTIHWDAMAIFRFDNGKIAEEWVCLDELGKLMQVGKLELTLW